MGFGDVKTPTYVSVEKDTAHFNVKRQEQEAFATQSISGFLVGIDHINGTYNGKPAPKLSLKFIDHTSNEDFIFQTSFTGGYAQTILNCLAGVEHAQFGVVGLKLVEKDGKAKMQVFHNEMYRQWKYKPEQMPKPEEYRMKSGEKIVDYTERTNWFRETVLPEVQAKLPSRYDRKELVENTVNNRHLIAPPSPPKEENIEWHRAPAALPERSAVAEYVPFPTDDDIPF
ncbi:MAG: hypothetical protein JNN25_01000 [Candidatus Kapabacteria bacterium]|nr:hypothetical protein [Candidatus Kapabacteria bacterium]